MLFAREGLLDVSIVAFQKALELDSSFSDAHFNLGLSYWKRGLKAQAASEFKFALRLNPNHSQARGMLDRFKKETPLLGIFY